MADEADISEVKEQLQRDMGIRQAQAAAANMPRGYSGDCIYCGEESLRLVNGGCAPCRDQRKLP